MKQAHSQHVGVFLPGNYGEQLLFSLLTPSNGRCQLQTDTRATRLGPTFTSVACHRAPCPEARTAARKASASDPKSSPENPKFEGRLFIRSPKGSKYLLRMYLDPLLPPKAILKRYLDPLGSICFCICSLLSIQYFFQSFQGSFFLENLRKHKKTPYREIRFPPIGFMFMLWGLGGREVKRRGGGQFWRLTPHSVQPSFLSKTGCFPCVFEGLLERRIPGKNGEGILER